MKPENEIERVLLGGIEFNFLVEYQENQFPKVSVRYFRSVEHHGNGPFQEIGKRLKVALTSTTNPAYWMKGVLSTEIDLSRNPALKIVSGDIQYGHDGEKFFKGPLVYLLKEPG